MRWLVRSEPSLEVFVKLSCKHPLNLIVKDLFSFYLEIRLSQKAEGQGAWHTHS